MGSVVYSIHKLSQPTNKQVLQQEAYPAIWPLLTPKTSPSLGLSPQNRRRPVRDVAECRAKFHADR